MMKKLLAIVLSLVMLTAASAALAENKKAAILPLFCLNLTRENQITTPTLAEITNPPRICCTHTWYT